MSQSQFSQFENQEEIKRLERNSFIIAVVTSVVAGSGTVAAFIFKFSSPWTILPICLAALVAIFLIRSGRFVIGNWLVIIVSFLSALAEVLQRSGEGINRGVIGLVFIGGYGLAAMPRSIRGRVLLFALVFANGMIVLDVVGPTGRPVSPQSSIQLILTLLTILIFLFFIAREFPNLDLRTKISFGILITGGVTVGVLSYFAIDRSSQLINTLSEKAENSVILSAQETLINQVDTEADLANHFFEKIADHTHWLSEYRIALHSQQTSLTKGEYWNAEDKLISLEDGKYGNPSSDVSSVFIPSIVSMNESVLRDLNISAYLDFSAPQLLEQDPSLLAIYYINDKGVVRYYPNIELATILPHDFDARQRPYYGITKPASNPERKIRWTTPYVDAAGGGLVVTVASPVYIQNRFDGVIAADLQLSTLTDKIASIKIGRTGYAFMLDDAGRIIYMPLPGYQVFGIDPNNLPENEFFDESLLDAANQEFRPIVQQIISGNSGLQIVNIKGVENYIVHTSIEVNGYSLAIVVPTAEMLSAIAVTRDEIDSQVQTALRSAALILVLLLAGAIMVSLGLGQLISAPLLRLTQTANQILDGNIDAQAEITTKDETGTLAQAFNAVTLQLGQTLAGLEQTIEERTSELFIASQNNERRAKQFQSISQVARTISSTLDFDSLLTLITTVISREFGFYHVGVFLLDTARGYAVLSAANSEGGQAMLARKHRLKVGEKGLVGFVSGTGRPRVALDTGADAIFFNNPDLPQTRSEIALPLRDGENIIGVLDVQSTEQNAFAQEDINILSTLADQVSIAIQNARQNEQTQKALAESEALFRQFVQTGWDQFTKREKLFGVRHTGAKTTLLYMKGTDAGNDYTSGVNQLNSKGGGTLHSIPIKLRGEVIGSVDVQAPDNRQWDQDEMDIVTAIIERAAIAMENARLLTESQKRAAKERTIGEISAKISAQSEVEDLLRTAAQELNRSLPGTEIAIHFKKDETE